MWVVCSASELAAGYTNLAGFVNIAKIVSPEPWRADCSPDWASFPRSHSVDLIPLYFGTNCLYDLRRWAPLLMGVLVVRYCLGFWKCYPFSYWKLGIFHCFLSVNLEVKIAFCQDLLHPSCFGDLILACLIHYFETNFLWQFSEMILPYQQHCCYFSFILAEPKHPHSLIEADLVFPTSFWFAVCLNPLLIPHLP